MERVEADRAKAMLASEHKSWQLAPEHWHFFLIFES